MHNFDEKALAVVKGSKLNPQDIQLVLSRIPKAMPHLKFSDNWTVFEEKGDSFAHRTKTGAHCHVQIKDAHIAIEVFSRKETLSNDDLQVLRDLCQEAAGLIQASTDNGVSLADFGVNAMSSVIAKYISESSAHPVSSAQVKNYFKFLRSLSGETYENQRISYGLILLPQKKRAASSVLEFDNKRFKRLTDGFSTAISLDVNGSIVQLTSLTAKKENKNSSLGRPWWIGPLADTASSQGGIGVALTKGGDILVVKDRELLISQRAGEWRLWRHSAITSAVRDSWLTRGHPGNLDRVLVALYRVALDLAFRRSGGLLVVASTWKKADKLVTAKGDLIGASSRSNSEQALDNSLSEKSILTMDRRVLADLASLDGALVIHRSGRLVAYGAMVRAKSNTAQQGARSRAAIGASEYGLAIKVSSDGGITVYRQGVCVVTL
ncbi:diadenylate cyclase [Archangium primigenium]|uniref:diadenylate cyclase n=1 Tax=[Archangium] primigenium TaxID=2792470 RepID=UPI00195DD3E6|nr:diadenylate cyclase [Archangium primigenium]MBM7118612.1 DNA integrity scanning protein DisA nucleotide-binding domain protein [Archangium primigenium]